MANQERSFWANQERSFWEINQSHYKKVIDNACSFFVSWFWSRSEINILFGVEYCGKKQIKSGSALSVFLSTRIFVFTVVKMLWNHEAQRVQTMLNHFRFVNLYCVFNCINYFGHLVVESVLYKTDIIILIISNLLINIIKESHCAFNKIWSRWLLQRTAHRDTCR